MNTYPGREIVNFPWQTTTKVILIKNVICKNVQMVLYIFSKDITYELPGRKSDHMILLYLTVLVPIITLKAMKSGFY